MDYSIFQQLGAATILASLIGLEREHKYQMHNHDKGFAGLRTFTLHGLLGALAYIISGYAHNEWFFLVMTFGFLAFIIVSYFITAKASGSSGITSETASVLVYLNGVLCAMGQYVLATAIALGLFFILHFKTPLHNWAKRMKDEEFLSTAEFIIIAFVVLPLLPNHGYGPYQVFNPYIIWLMVVLISGISFASYIAIKLFGARKGIGLIGFLGGLISSTALTLSFAAQSKKNPEIVGPYVFAVILANSAMFFRILVLIFILNITLLGHVIVPLLVMGVIAILAAVILWRKMDTQKNTLAVEKGMIKMTNPFSLAPALKFAALFSLITLFVRYAQDVYGDKGLYLVSVISATLDVDPIVISVTNLANHSLEITAGVIAVVIATMTNTMVKGGIFMLFGNKKVALRIALIFALMLVGGGISLLFVL